MGKTETIRQLFVSVLDKKRNIPAYSNALSKRVQNVISTERCPVESEPRGESRNLFLSRFLLFAHVLSACPRVLRRKAGRRARKQGGSKQATSRRRINFAGTYCPAAALLILSALKISSRHLYCPAIKLYPRLFDQSATAPYSGCCKSLFLHR